MRKIVFLLSFIVLSTSYSCMNNETVDAEEKVIKEAKVNVKLKGANSECVFDKTDYDLGKIQQGEIVKYTMTFTNKGEDLLVITSARASCGCTVPKWTREPIAKGEQGQLEITFDSSGRSGKQHKSIVLTTNSVVKMVEVHFTAEIAVN